MTVRTAPDLLTAFAGLLEAEWYNGNLDEKAYRRLNADLTGVIASLAAALSSPETTPAGVLDEAALAKALEAIWPHHTEGVGSSPPSPSDHSYEVWEPFLPGSPDSVARALAAALGRSGSGGGRG